MQKINGVYLDHIFGIRKSVSTSYIAMETKQQNLGQQNLYVEKGNFIDN